MNGDPQDDDDTATSHRRPNLWRRIFGGGPGRPPGDDDAPKRIGRYRVIELLGEGGMGRVFVAEDETLQRRVALKVLKEWDDSSRRRFLREARAAARISHPNVCPVFEVGEDGGRPFLAMELLTGETLAVRLQRGPLTVEAALALARDVLAALGAVHEAGIVHRDLKPSNVFLTSHGAKLLDFGLARDVPRDFAKALMSGGDITRKGLLTGTPGYMAPEQILGHPVDERADLFAAGVVFYEALVGRRPFGGGNVVQVLSAILHEEPSSLAGTPFETFDASLRRALSKPPEHRYDSARDMMDALHTTARAAQARVRTGARTREPFVGRQAELAWLEERLAAAVAGEGSVAFVTGERGVGKSTLVGEFLRRVNSEPGRVSLAAGRCVETEGPGEAFLPLQDAVGRILMSRGRERTLELLRTYAPTLCLQFRAVLIPDPDGALQREAVGATKERFLREAGDFMEATSREFPVVLYLEDLQWADAASVELLHHLGCRIARQRTLIVGTFRHADVDAANPSLKRCAVDLIARGAGRELALGTLSREDLQGYLDARFEGNRFPASLAGTLHERTEGLALFARSLVDLLLERGDIARDTGAWGLTRPVEELDLAPTKGLRELVRQHIEALPAEKRELLQHASVAGREFLSPVVAHTVVGDIAVVEEHLRGLCDVRRLILNRGEEELPDGTPATRYRFAHGLYQAVLYQELVASRRVELHLKMAQRLQHHWGSEAPRLATEIAQHCEHGRDSPGAVRFRLDAGDSAVRIYAYDEAAEHYEWASRSIEKLAPDDRPAWTLALHQKRGGLRHTQARFDDAVGDFEAMLESARKVGSAEAERVALCRLCDALFYARRVDEMAARAQELMDVATRGGNASDLVAARSRLGQVLVCEGHLAEAIPLLDRVIEDAREIGPPDALLIGLSNRGFVHYWQIEYSSAEALMEETAALATDQDEAFDVLAARMFVGLSRVKLGRVSEGIQEFLEGISLARRNGDRFWLPRLVSYVGWAHREVLAHERARDFDTEALRLVREASLPQAPETEALLYLASDEMRIGSVDRASALLAELEAKVAQSDWFRWMDALRLAAVSAEHWTACGEPNRGAEHAGRLSGLAKRLGAHDYRCAAERFRAEAALVRGSGVEEAAAHLAEALEELRRFPAPLEMWRSARLLGRLRRQLGDEEGAGLAFAEAAEAVRTIAAGITEEGLRDGFLEAPEVREVLEAAAEK
jgi:serine/threonine protein kinase/tetratricopeptide (TPR) repeat protein